MKMYYSSNEIFTQAPSTESSLYGLPVTFFFYQCKYESSRPASVHRDRTLTRRLSHGAFILQESGAWTGCRGTAAPRDSRSIKA